MNYYLQFGRVRNIDIGKVNMLLKEHNSDKGIGLDKLINIGFEKLNEDISDHSKEVIRGDYWAITDDAWRSSDFDEEYWVSEKSNNRNRGLGYRSINTEFINEFKKIKGGREFFRSIKDEYTDNSTHPGIEICLINTPAFKESLKILSNELLTNEELPNEHMEFIKWVFWWGTQSLKRMGNLASIRFSKD